MKFIFPLLAVIGGIAIAFQVQINGTLGKRVGAIESAFVSFCIGTAALFFMTLFFGRGNIISVGTVPKWQLFGGLLGAFYVYMSVLVVPKIGVASTLIGVVAGQIVIGALIDHFGLLGGNQIPLDGKKIMAILLLFVSLYLFNHK
ncbi:DMT family transporter [Peribacillus sp. SCS-155]|uniref:DMT family transporter n=1 Tax=Peribacillus sedimenti TaxID=3115297 RepID=UPI0039062824